jgi:hypothetical protein
MAAPTTRTGDSVIRWVCVGDAPTANQDALAAAGWTPGPVFSRDGLS